MKTALRIATFGLSIVVALGGVGATYVSYSSSASAHEALINTVRLYAARLEVAEAQKQLEGGDIGDALERARAANATALRVGQVTEKIVALLEPTSDTAERTLEAGRRGARSTVSARRQTEIVAGSLGAIAGYQRSASRYAAITNRALRRILVALRKTNEEFP